jgi:hypothetical protein
MTDKTQAVERLRYKTIEINIPSYMKSFTNNMRVVEINGSTVGECLSHLIKQ